MKLLAAISLAITALLVVSCGTTDSSLKNQGKSAAYIQGFHDGKHSGMKEEGNHYERYVRDDARFRSDSEYKSGWLAGELEGKTLQDEATSIGMAAAGAYSSSQIQKEVDKSRDFEGIANDAVQGTDTSSLNRLGQ